MRLGTLVSLIVAIFAAYLNSAESGDLLSVYAAPFVGAFLGTFAVAWLWSKDLKRQKDRPFVPSSAAMFGLGLWLYLILGPLPSLRDQSFLLAREGVGSFGFAYLYCGLAIGAYALGASLIAMPETTANPDVEAQLSGLALLLLLAFCWGTRVVLAEGGNLSAYHSGEAEDLTGVVQYAFYGTNYLAWAIIPLAEYQRQRCGWKGRAFWSLMACAEIAVHFLAVDRTRMIMASAELVLCRAYFSGWTVRRVIGVLAAGAVVFALVINPFVYAVRGALNSGDFGSNQLVANAELSLSVLIGGGSGRSEFSGLEERDAKYRINGMYWIAGMIGADALGTSEHGLGSFTVREIGAMVPSFLWPSKGEYVLRNAKFEISKQVGVTPTDYMQTLPGFWYADFSWGGIAAMMVAGVFDQAVCRALLRRLSSPFAFALMALIATINFAPTEDFSGHFLLRFRETVPFFGLFLLFERRLHAQTGQLLAEGP